MSNSIFLYFYLNGQTLGPYSLEQGVQMLAGGQIQETTYCSINGNAWAPLKACGMYGEHLIQQATLMNGGPAFKMTPADMSSASPDGGQEASPVSGAAVPDSQPTGLAAMAAGTGKEPRPRVQPAMVEQREVSGGFSFVAGSGDGRSLLKDEFPDEEAEEEPESPVDDDSPRVLCMHCWHLFRQSRIKYISRHPELAGDSILGPMAQKRFLPVKFNADDEALDEYGVACPEMACPRCHLAIPKAILAHGSLLVSIVGAPSAGKSYFLTAMLHSLKQTLAELNFSLEDADPTHNMVLTHYEETLFEGSAKNQYVALPKTELQGNDFSSQTQINRMTVELPLPFVYTLRPMVRRREGDASAKPHNLVFYDNAGEQFEPGRDYLTRIATNHLLQSNCVFFLFDPFKDSRTLRDCTEEDPQAGVMQRNANQLQIFNEMVARIRQKPSVSENELYPVPLVVVVPKYDAWKSSFDLDLATIPVVGYLENRLPALNLSVITLASYLLREWLRKRVPELVSNAEAAFREVYYLPLSALGKMPTMDPKSKMLGVWTDGLRPVWADVPILFELWHEGLLPGMRSRLSDEEVPVDEHCHFKDGVMLFAPPNRKPVIVPSIYWGQVVHDEALGFIRFPHGGDAEAEFHF